MKSLIFGLSLVGAAVGQSVNGVSSVPMYAAPASSATPTADSSYGQYGADPAYQAPAYQAPPSQYTSLPSSSAKPYYEEMPYSSMVAGGYKSLNCGYGYKKDEDGHCKPEDWVNFDFLSCSLSALADISSQYQDDYQGCYETMP